MSEETKGEDGGGDMEAKANARFKRMGYVLSPPSLSSSYS